MKHWAFAPRAATICAMTLAILAGCTEVSSTTDHARAAEESGTFRKVCGVGIGPEQRRLKLDAFFNENIFEPRGVFFTTSPEFSAQFDPVEGFPRIKSTVEESRSNVTIQMHGVQADCYYEMTGYHFSFWHPSSAQNVGESYFDDLEDENDFLIKIIKFRAKPLQEFVDVVVLKDSAFVSKSEVIKLSQ